MRTRRSRTSPGRRGSIQKDHARNARSRRAFLDCLRTIRAHGSRCVGNAESASPDARGRIELAPRVARRRGRPRRSTWVARAPRPWRTIAQIVSLQPLIRECLTCPPFLSPRSAVGAGIVCSACPPRSVRNAEASSIQRIPAPSTILRGPSAGFERSGGRPFADSSRRPGR